MCGACVRVRKCSSASFGSGTARNCFSIAASDVALRKPKMGDDSDEAEPFLLSVPVDAAETRMADERSPAKKSLMVGVEASKVAQTLERLLTGKREQSFARNPPCNALLNARILADSSVLNSAQETGETSPIQSRGKSSARDGSEFPRPGLVKYCGRAFSHSTMLRPEGSYEMRPARTVMRASSFTFPSNLATPQSV